MGSINREKEIRITVAKASYQKIPESDHWIKLRS